MNTTRAAAFLFALMGVASHTLAFAVPPEAVAASPASAVAAAELPRMPLGEALPEADGECALQKYIKFDDGVFAWERANEIDIEGATVYNLRVTSQRWRTEKEVDQPVWKHWVTVAVPHQIRYRTPIFIIGGGSHRAEPPNRVPTELSLLLRAAGAVVIHIDNVPNQPLKLEGEDEQRYEDNLVARSWVLAMRDDDASWLVRFPMVKSAVKGMDAAEAFLNQLADDPNGPGKDVRPDGFFVVGASKRGWTTWLTAAVDKRVKGMAPMVIDVLNMHAHTPHHWRSYGFWAPTLRDYQHNNIPEKFGSPELAKVIAHEDPLAYMARVKDIPKYIVNASGDEFFPTDSLRHYESLITGPWRARCVPNAGHSLRNTTVPFDILGFYRATVTNTPLPEISWKTEGDTLIVRTSVAPAAVTLWEATNPKARDFRFSEIKNAWEGAIITPSNDNELEYTAKLTAPTSGYRAYLVECKFPPAPGAAPGEALVFTTRVFIAPDTLPFELPTAAKQTP